MANWAFCRRSELEQVGNVILSKNVVLQVDALYNRDIARTGGAADGAPDEDYKKFMSEIGMPQPSGRSQGDSFSRPHPGLGMERWPLFFECALHAEAKLERFVAHVQGRHSHGKWTFKVS